VIGVLVVVTGPDAIMHVLRNRSHSPATPPVHLDRFDAAPRNVVLARLMHSWPCSLPTSFARRHTSKRDEDERDDRRTSERGADPPCR